MASYKAQQAQAPTWPMKPSRACRAWRMPVIGRAWDQAVERTVHGQFESYSAILSNSMFDA